VWGCAFSAIGYAFGNVIEEMLGRIGTGRLILFGAAALLAVGGGWFAWRKWRERSA
jgi:membrane protein DedA with SNARE-associated domain